MKEQKKTIELKDLAIDSCQKHSADLSVQNEALKAENNSALRNPIIMTGVGILAGIFLANLVLRQ